MNEDFDLWNIKKKNIHEKSKAPFFHEREIWWCSLGINIGFEQNGSGADYYRPVLILKALSINTFFAIPLTTSKNKHKFRPYIGIVNGDKAHALLSQIRVIDSKRLVHKICYLDGDVFKDIRKTVRNMF